MATKKYTAVVLGCGNIGALLESDPKRPKPATHAGAFLHNKKTTLVGLVDTDTSILSKAVKMFPGVSGYTDAATCLKDLQPDIVAIATPPQTHRALIELCAKNGVRAIVCEKPLAYSLKDAKAIEALVAKHRLVLVVNFQRRFFEQFTKVKKELSQKIGAIRQVTCYYSNGVVNNGSHTLDALSYMLGDSIASVMAMTNSGNTTHPKGDSNIDALMKTKKGTVVTLQSLNQHEWGVHDIHLLGSKGALYISEYGYKVTSVPLEGSPFGGVKQLASGKAKSVVKKESMVAGALEQLLLQLEKRSVARGTIEESVVTLAVLEALQKSAKMNRLIQL